MNTEQSFADLDTRNSFTYKNIQYMLTKKTKYSKLSIRVRDKPNITTHTGA